MTKAGKNPAIKIGKQWRFGFDNVIWNNGLRNTKAKKAGRYEGSYN
jgi:hypothetical protein